MTTWAVSLICLALVTVTAVLVTIAGRRARDAARLSTWGEPGAPVTRDTAAPNIPIDIITRAYRNALRNMWADASPLDEAQERRLRDELVRVDGGFPPRHSNA